MGPFEYKKIPFEGYMKLAYLHPNVFTPDSEISSRYVTGKYCIIRTARLSAHHDGNIRGLDKTTVEKLICVLESNGMTIFIDSEDPMEELLSKFRLQIRKNHFHHLVAFAELVISDSQSLSVEAALLGVPSIRYNDFAGKISVLEELEYIWRLTFGIKPGEQERLFSKLYELLHLPNRKEEFQQRRQRMLSQKIDVKEFMVWFIENYPESIKQMKQNTMIQNQFKTVKNAL
jgi:predicted glycosyltransferase